MLIQYFLPPSRIVLVESIPEGLEFNSSTTNPSIFQAWLNLVNEARDSLDIASFYWTLTNKDTHTDEPTADQVSWLLHVQCICLNTHVRMLSIVRFF